MSSHTSYITIDSVILDYMNEAELSQQKYFKLWHLAFRGMEDLGMDFFYRVQAVKLPINANKTVTLPADVSPTDTIFLVWWLFEYILPDHYLKGY